MELFRGYVLQSQLVKNAKVSTSLFSQMNLKSKNMGGYRCIQKDSLPFKYKIIAENKCEDLYKYCSFAYLSSEIGMCEDYLASIERYRPFTYKRIGKIKLFELNNEFIKNINKGLNPFKIKNKDDEEYAELIIEMQGLKIGFY